MTSGCHISSQLPWRRARESWKPARADGISERLVRQREPTRRGRNRTGTLFPRVLTSGRENRRSRAAKTYSPRARALSGSGARVKKTRRRSAILLAYIFISIYMYRVCVCVHICICLYMYVDSKRETSDPISYTSYTSSDYSTAGDPVLVLLVFLPSPRRPPVSSSSFCYSTHNREPRGIGRPSSSARFQPEAEEISFTVTPR